MSFHKPELHAMLFHWKQEAERTELFEIQNLQTVQLRHIPYFFREYPLRENFCQAVEKVGDDPIKHFY